MSPKASPELVRFGALGCGEIAWRNVLPAMHRAGVPVTAVASRDLARAERFADRFGGSPVVGYEALLERSDVDAVYIAVPTGLHHHWARRALDAGKHVLVEKPLTATLAEADDLVATARKQERWLGDGFMFLHHSQHAAVRRLVDEGRIGEPCQFTGVFGIPPRPAGDIRYRADLGGGALLDVGVYPVRAAQLLLGTDIAVVGSVLRVDPELDVDLGGSALLYSTDGVPVQVSFSFQSTYRSRYAIWGSAGRITLDRAFTPPPAFTPCLRLELPDGASTIELPPDDQFSNLIRAFVAGVRGEVEFEPHAARLLRQAALIDQIRDVAHRVPARP